jgi:GTPase Era involved in 16S rRNA processing
LTIYRYSPLSGYGGENIDLTFFLIKVKEEMKKEKRRIQEQLRRIKRNQVLLFRFIFF